MSWIFACLIFLESLCFSVTQETFQRAQKAFDVRWKAVFGPVRPFPVWSAGLSDAELSARFHEMNRDQMAFPGLRLHGKKGPFALTLSPEHPRMVSYSRASDTYNANIVMLAGRMFLAHSAPTQRSLPNFYELLARYQVTDIVRLVSESGSFLYWQPASRTVTLAGRTMHMHGTDSWRDGAGYAPESLFALVASVMATERKDQVVAVHCHAGIGRTGTFLAAYVLIRELERQVKMGVARERWNISVDRAVCMVSIQRALRPLTLAQYICLYRLLDWYYARTR